MMWWALGVSPRACLGSVMVEPEEKVILAKPADAGDLLARNRLRLDDQQFVMTFALIEPWKSEETRQR
jgi:hypothetical protein